MFTLENLLALQRAQYAHDTVAHKDILALKTKERITHMTLHFAKYVGALAKSPDRVGYERILVDIFIISLASANTLNINLSEEIKRHNSVTTYKKLAHRFAYQPDNVLSKTLLSLSIATGAMAKACESLDHVEKFDSRGTLEIGIVEIATIALAASSVVEIDVLSAIRERWRAVERKSVLGVAEDPLSPTEPARISFLQTG